MQSRLAQAKVQIALTYIQINKNVRIIPQIQGFKNLRELFRWTYVTVIQVLGKLRQKD
jgi:hypothetical protein